MVLDIKSIFTKNFVNLTLNQGVNIISTLIYTPILFQTLGDENFGLMHLAFSIVIMLSILTNPKNALVKQYKKLFDLEGVDLEFTNDALLEIVEIAKRRKTGARALRSVIEEAMVEIMYEVPSLPNIESCIITDQVITNASKPIYKMRKKKTA